MMAFVLLWIAIIFLLTLFWSREVGVIRGLSAGLLRAGWTLPLILSLFPWAVTKRIPGSVAMQPIHILVDDSDSMSNEDALGESSSKQLENLLRRVDAVCAQSGCVTKVTKLSEIADDTRFGYTPLSRVIEPWLYKTAGDPWIILSDGGDFRPSSAWDESIRGRGLRERTLRRVEPPAEADLQKTIGLVVAFGRPRTPGFSLEAVSLAPLAFEGKSVQMGATVTRLNSERLPAERVQVQVSLDGKVMSASEAIFSPGAPAAQVEFSFSAPRRGPHIVTARVLPVAGELDTWDNSQTRVLDVMPNTVGVLHLLGSPAWDGRFMRRFLKAEPKFDVISFFILRDPWDSQQVSEREMSLIPFPVERLFKEELVNFRVIVMQNFTLMRFLQPEYQQNLVNFVKDGGGLLFVGGARALTQTDVSSSALAGLLPFAIEGSASSSKDSDTEANELFDTFGSLGSTWDSDRKFSIAMANPEASQRALADVYEKWLAMNDRLTTLQGLSGLHEMENFKFRKDESTPLLEAKLSDGRTVPLAVASYPGKGRALWLFTDSMWRLAMSPDSGVARSDYHTFMDSALGWLTKGDMRGAITVRDLKVNPIGDRSDTLNWRAVFSGSAARYLRSANSTKISVCGVGLSSRDITFGGAAGEAILAEGELKATLREGSLCALKLDAEHPAFGSISVTGWTIIPETLKDANIGASPVKLNALAAITGSTFVDANQDRARRVELWVQSWGTFDGNSLPDKTETRLDYYWPKESPWIWMVIFLLPLEVIIRRWDRLFGGWTKTSGQEE